MNLAQKTHFVIYNAIRVVLLFAIISAIINSKWTILFISSLTFFLTFLTAIIKRNYRVDLPVEFELAIVLFIYMSIFLGGAQGYYTAFWWWDIILHIGAGVVLGFAGFIILYSLYIGGKIQASPGTIAIFAFCFAVAIGTVWEIFEFSMDNFFGMNMQKSGLIDTMWDLIVDSLGALLTSTLGYVYLKGGKTRLFERLLKRFIRQNPHFFAKNLPKNR